MKLGFLVDLDLCMGCKGCETRQLESKSLHFFMKIELG